MSGPSGRGPRVGLVLGGGGITGHAYHAAVLSALAEATGWEARDAALVTGTSAGSIVGALVRGGFSGSDLAARLIREPLSKEGMRLAEIMGPPERPVGVRRPRPLSGMASPRLLVRLGLRPWSARPGIVAAAALPPGLVASTYLSTGIDRLLGTGWPDPPLWVCAVSLLDGRLAVFGRDGAPSASVGDAVRASCAIPSFYAPVDIGGVRYVDGGVRSPTNADLLRHERLDLVVVSSPMSSCRGAGLADTPMRALARLALSREVLRLRRAGMRVVVFEPTPEVTATMRFSALNGRRAGAVVRGARVATLRLLESSQLRERLTPLTA